MKKAIAISILLSAILAKANQAYAYSFGAGLRVLANNAIPTADDSGNVPLVLTCGAFGAWTFWTSLQLADAKVNRYGFASGGAVLGLGTAYLLTNDSDVSLAEYGYFTNATMFALLAGRGAGYYANFSKAPLWLSLGGQVAGMFWGSAVGPHVDYNFGDAFITSMAAAQFGFATFAGVHIARAKYHDRNALPYLATATGGIVYGILVPNLKLEGYDLPLFGLSMFAGAYLGAFAPALLHDGLLKSSDFNHGLILGQAAGFLVALPLQQVVRTSFGRASALSAGVLAGAGFGFAAGALVKPKRALLAFQLTQLGGVIGAAAIGFSGLELDSDQDLILPLALGLGGSLGLRQLQAQQSSQLQLAATTKLAAIAAGAGMGLGTGLVLGHFAHPKLHDYFIFALGTSATTAATIGFVEQLPNINNSKRNLIVGGGVLGGAALSVAAHQINLDDWRIPWMLTTGSLGAAWGAFVPGYWLGEHKVKRHAHIEKSATSHYATYGALFGGGSMLLIGAATSQAFAPKPSDMARVSIESLGASAALGGLGLLAPRWDLRLKLGLIHGAGLSVFALTTAQAAMSEHALPFTYRLLEARMALLGMAAGSLLPLHWDTKVQQRQILGGALFGLGVGGVLGKTMALTLPLHNAADQGEELLLASLLGSASGGFAAVSNVKNSSMAWSAELGLLSGAAAAFAIAPHTEYNETQVALTINTGIAGFASGYWYAWWQGQKPAKSKQLVGALMFGGAVGALTGMGLSQWSVFSAENGLTALALNGALNVLPLGYAIYQDRQNAASLGGTELALSLAATLLGTATGRFFAFSTEDIALVATLTTIGAVQGAAAGFAHWDRNPTKRLIYGGALMGAGAGAALGVGLAQFTEFTPEQISRMAIFWAAGATAAIGADLIGPQVSQATSRKTLQLAAGSAFVIGLADAAFITMDDLDYTTTLYLTSLGALQGMLVPIGWHKKGEAFATKTAVGGALAGGAAGLFLGLTATPLFTQYIEAPALGKLALFTATAFSTSTGASLLLTKPGKQAWGIAEGGGFALLAVSQLVASQNQYHSEDIALVSLAGASGGVMGYALKAFFAEPHGTRIRAASTLLGFGVASTSAALIAPLLHLNADDVSEAFVLSMAGLGTGIGLAHFIKTQQDSERYSALALCAAGVLGLGAGLVVPKHTNYSETDLFYIATMTTYGAATGSVADVWRSADFANIRSRSYFAGSAIGAGAGLTLGMATTSLLQLKGDDVFETAIDGALITATATGATLLASKNYRHAAAALQLGAMGGTILAGGISKYTEFKTEQILLGTVITAQALWSGVGVSLMLRGDDRQVAGVSLLAAGAGGLAGSQLARYLHVEWNDALTMLMTSVWGAWIAGWGGEILKHKLKDVAATNSRSRYLLGATAIGCDAGMLISGIWISSLGGLPLERFGIINLSGLGGMLTGLLAGAVTSKIDTATGIVAGSAAGLLLGTIFTIPMGHVKQEASPNAAASNNNDYNMGAWARSKNDNVNVMHLAKNDREPQSRFPFKIVAITPTIMPLVPLDESKGVDGLAIGVIGIFE